LRAGYHSDGAVTFLEKLREAIGPRVEVPVHPGSFPLHPEISVRLEEVRKGLSQLAYAANKFDTGYRALHEGDFNLAINAFEELTDVFPQSQNALVNLGAAYHGKYRSAKRAEEPAPIILLAAALEPELKRLLAPRGLREGLDRSWLLIAREKYQTVLDADAENLVARNDLGVALLDDGEIDAAIAQLEIVVAADDADPGSFKNLGIAFCAKLRADRAGSPAATESERAAEESDLRLKAKEAFEKYLKAHPGDVDAKLLLQPLQSGVGQAP
ncbi:MAG: tetratricopeptide repeat protein, partial [Acidobacteria bacterium]|nr:tetratricopeptide repeat protein [Acidobacteriota bacterium]